VGVNISPPVAEGIAEKSDSVQLSKSFASCSDKRGGSAVNRLLRSCTTPKRTVSSSSLPLPSCSIPASSGSASPSRTVSISGGGVSSGGAISGSSRRADFAATERPVKPEFAAGDLYAGGGVSSAAMGDSFITRNVRRGGVRGRVGGTALKDPVGECERPSEDIWLDSDGACDVSSFRLLIYTY
jgi:hypothetical protein